MTPPAPLLLFFRRVSFSAALLSATWLCAQTLPTTEPVPSTLPATGASTRATTRPESPRLVIPAGFVRLEVSGRHFLIDPADEAFVRSATPLVVAPTRPTTMPADLIANATTLRDKIVTGMAHDLNVPEAQVAAFYDNDLLPAMKNYAAVVPANTLMVTSVERLKTLAAGGWTNSGFRYNRVTNDVRFIPTPAIVSDLNDGDGLVFLLVDPAAPDAEKRKADLAAKIAGVEAQILQVRSNQGMYLAQAGLTKFIGGDVLGKIGVPLDQNWLLTGTTYYLVAKYFSLLTGHPFREVVFVMMYEPRNVPIHASSVNLLKPVDPSSIRPEAMLPYTDALRRKSVRAVDELVLRGGADAIPGLLNDLREKKPADAQALVDLIKAKTGTDLSPYLREGVPPAQ